MKSCVAFLSVVLLCTTAHADVKLVGPDKVRVNQSFEVSVEGLSFDLSIFADGGVPPQVEWRVIPEGGSIRSRMEVLIVMDETTKKPKWVVSPYATVILTEPGRVGVVLMVVQDGVGILLVHEVVAGTDPDPPIPPPPPDQRWQIVIVYESKDNLPRSQQVLLNSITFRRALQAKGHYLLEGGIVDQHIRDKDGKIPTELAPFFESCAGKHLPCICLAPVDGGEVSAYPLPANEAAVFELLENPSSYLQQMPTMGRRLIYRNGYYYSTP